MSMVDTGIRALNARELELVSGAGEKNPFAGVKASAEGWLNPPPEDKECGWGMVVIIGLLAIFGR